MGSIAWDSWVAAEDDGSGIILEILPCKFKSATLPSARLAGTVVAPWLKMRWFPDFVWMPVVKSCASGWCGGKLSIWAWNNSGSVSTPKVPDITLSSSGNSNVAESGKFTSACTSRATGEVAFGVASGEVPARSALEMSCSFGVAVISSEVSGLACCFSNVRYRFRHVCGGRLGSQFFDMADQLLPNISTPFLKISSSSGVQSASRPCATGPSISLYLLEHWSSFRPGMSVAISCHKGPSRR